jgi:hypothetical protein
MIAVGISSSDPDGGVATYVRVIDARSPNADSVAGGRQFKTLDKVGSVTVTRRGSVAWIACPARYAKKPASRGPECTRPGKLDRVRVALTHQPHPRG